MPDEKSMEDAPVYYNADSASGWAIGYNAALAELSPAAADVIAERDRQVKAEGWTPEHDDDHRYGELALAAACYAIKAADDRPLEVSVSVNFAGRSQPAGAFFIATLLWPWQSQWWKPKDRRSNLVRAAALIVAEIERLDRAARKAA